MLEGKRRIAINTIAVYTRMAIITIATLVITRFALSALGQSDYGLYDVVGSMIAMMNMIGIAMHTTTRRFINIEVGKPDGNLNQVFNICRVIHFIIALLFVLVAELLGMWYVNHVMNIPPGKYDDAFFIFQISIIVTCIGLVNIPYQGLINAFEKFWQLTVIDIVANISKIIVVFLLFVIQGNKLRLFAIGMGVTTLLQFVLIRVLCFRQWKEIVRNNWYGERHRYKEIFVFNNYTALGAASTMARTQGSSLLINYFFGTVVNAAFAVAYQILGFVQLFANNIGTASAPQITQKYSSGDVGGSVSLCGQINRFTILIMICISFPLYVGMNVALNIWLSDIPAGTLLFCRWGMVYALVASFSSSISTLIQATGKIKWFQIIGSGLEFLVIILCVFLFRNGFPPVSLLVCLTIFTFINRFVVLWLMKLLVDFDSYSFVKSSYLPPVKIIAIMSIATVAYMKFQPGDMLLQLVSALAFFCVSVVLSFLIGLTTNEKIKFLHFFISKDVDKA